MPNNNKYNSFQDPPNVSKNRKRPSHFSTAFFKLENIRKAAVNLGLSTQWDELIKRIEKNQEELFKMRQKHNYSNSNPRLLEEYDEIQDMEHIIYGDRTLLENILDMNTKMRVLKKALTESLSINNAEKLYNYHFKTRIPYFITTLNDTLENRYRGAKANLNRKR